MYIALRGYFRFIFRFFGLGLVRNSELNSLRIEKIEYDNLRVKLEFFLESIFNPTLKSKISIDDLVNESKSESGQDLFALIANEFLENKVFIEIGAFDGVTFSNSYLLEKVFNWDGILVECIPRNFSKIKNSRKCISIFGAVSNEDGHTIEVIESPAANLSSTIHNSTDSRWRTVSHQVPNYSLDVILEMGADMGGIGFLSVDIEGAEFMVLKDIDLSRYSIKAICIEHNFRPESQDLKRLIESQGYRSVYEEFSGNDFWFIRD
jgi:FkbM family methyltransferase